MHVFVSAGEPSGDLHGANLVRAIRERCPDATIIGFGGPKMAAAGGKLLFPLTSLAVMWFKDAIANLRQFFRLGKQAADYFRDEKPDAVVLIDYPGFHFALAKRAKAAGVPVYFFVPPQLWGWAGWRVRKVRRWFAGVLTALPFEEEWYRSRGVATRYVGHPYFDELAAQRLDADFLAAERAKGGPVVALLPGSRNREVEANFPVMLAAAARVHDGRSGVRFVVASFNERQRAVAEGMAAGSGLPIEFHDGRTPEIIELADCCLSVSGSVSLEMMYRLKPAVIVYKVGKVFQAAARLLRTAKYFTLVNLLADRELYPEFGSSRDMSGDAADRLLAWLNDPAALAGRVDDLRRLREIVAVPGACERAAAFLEEAVRANATAGEGRSDRRAA